MKSNQFSLLLLVLALGNCLSAQTGWVPELLKGPGPIGIIDTSESTNGIVIIPETADRKIRRWFVKYTKLVAPNGQPIHILAQDQWSDAQIVRARKVLEHILTDYPGSRFGSNKAQIANAMTKRRACLVLFNDEPSLERAFRGSFGDLELGCQDLRANECPVEGERDYLAHDTRDAAFEEILHFVHDYGIRPVIPKYDELIHQANLAAAERGIWTAWPADEPENHRNEYIAAIYDNYLDLWAERPLRYEGVPIEDGMLPVGASHFGAYAANSREKLLKLDPLGYQLIEDFFPPYLNYEVVLPSDFVGTFFMCVEADLRYTKSSQHLLNVSLSGDLPSSIIANDWPNNLHGNAGDNQLTGGAGNDVLNGGAGHDQANFAGKFSEYKILRTNAQLTVIDLHSGRDGVDTLSNIESLRFADQLVELSRFSVAE